jgi:8-oxo-dGTP diphosphatase
VIVSRCKDNWVWVRKHGAATWELPAGHIEVGEEPIQAAKRELWEETGAIDYILYPICDFSIIQADKRSHNQLFYAEIKTLGNLPNSEIEEVQLRKNTPKDLTHGSIQPKLLSRVKVYLKGRKQ